MSMYVSRCRKRFHDVYGVRHRRGGGICSRHYLVGKSEIDDKYYYPNTGPSLSQSLWHFDKTICYEHDGDKYIRTSYSVERLRK